LGVLPESARDVVQGEGVVIGLRRWGATGEFWVDDGGGRYRSFIRQVVRIFKEVLGDAMPAEFTSIALNHNTVARRHADCKNSNVSAMAVVGDLMMVGSALWDQG
jgi:hypothetical protein